MVKKKVTTIEKIIYKATSIFLNIPNNPLKDLIREFLHGEVTSERIVEYALVFSHLGKEPARSIKILDIGCGYSNFPVRLASMGYSVTAVDLQKYTFEHPNLRFVQGDINKLSLGVGKFDIVTCISVLEHVGLDVYGGEVDPRGDRLALKSIHKLLKKRGRLILTMPFGQESRSFSYRSYSWAQVKDLLAQFKIRDTHFYVGMKNKWFPSDRMTSEKIDNRKKVKGIIFLVATKT